MARKMSFDEFADFIYSVSKNDDPNMFYPPELDDLYFLYSFVRDHSVVSVLELGGGYSTLAMAKAVRENEEAFGPEHVKSVRHPNPFKLLSIDASKEFSRAARGRLSSDLLGTVVSHVSSVSIHSFGSQGQICSVYDDFPFFIPDLVYLDGPDSDQVVGSVRGFSFVQPHSVPMGSDLLGIEPQLWPGTYIVTDGRMANARFLKNNFTRSWEMLTDYFGNRTVLRLSEEHFGQVSAEHQTVRLIASRALLDKELPLKAKDK